MNDINTTSNSTKGGLEAKISQGAKNILSNDTLINTQLITGVKNELDDIYKNMITDYYKINSAYILANVKEIPLRTSDISGSINKEFIMENINVNLLFENLLYANLSYIGKMNIYKIIVAIYYAEYVGTIRKIIKDIRDGGNLVELKKKYTPYVELIEFINNNKGNLDIIDGYLSNDNYVREDMLNSVMQGIQFTTCVGERCNISLRGKLSMVKDDIIDVIRIKDETYPFFMFLGKT